MKGIGAPQADPGRNLFIGWEENRWTNGLERRLLALRPGGVLFSTRNLRSPGDVAKICARIVRTLDAVPLLALEEEGGTFDPLRRWLPPLPSPQGIGGNTPASARRMGELVGRALSLLGFNTNLAPVLEVSSSSSDPLFRTRTFGWVADQVAEFGEAFIRGQARQGVLACGKYFPGLAGARRDRSSGLLVVSKPMAQMWRVNLLPYRRLLGQLPMVMVCHAAYKAYDFDLLRPAVTSTQVLEGLLRVKLGYGGVTVADLSDSEFLCRAFDPLEIAVQTLHAGCDLLLVRDWGTAEAVRVELVKAQESGRLSLRRIEQAGKRLRSVTHRLIPPSGEFARHAWKHLMRDSIKFGAPERVKESEIA